MLEKRRNIRYPAVACAAFFALASGQAVAQLPVDTLPGDGAGASGLSGALPLQGLAESLTDADAPDLADAEAPEGGADMLTDGLGELLAGSGLDDPGVPGGQTLPGLEGIDGIDGNDRERLPGDGDFGDEETGRIDGAIALRLDDDGMLPDEAENPSLFVRYTLDPEIHQESVPPGMSLRACLAGGETCRVQTSSPGDDAEIMVQHIFINEAQVFPPDGSAPAPDDIDLELVNR